MPDPSMDLSLGAVPGGSADLRAYLARPDGDGPWPGVVAIHEVFGADEQFRRHCDRLAGLGYLTLGLDLFSDSGDSSKRRCIVTTMRALIAGHGKPVTDIDAGREYLAASADCAGRIGIIGFCMGGGFALLTAPRGFAAASANYGQTPRHVEQLEGACPIVANYGGRDPAMIGQPGKLRKAAAATGTTLDLKVYPGAGHSFMNTEMIGPLQPLQRVLNIGPKPEAAADAWQRIEQFFAAHLNRSND